MKIVALRDFDYGTPMRAVREGDEFDMPERDAKTLILARVVRQSEQLEEELPIANRRGGKGKYRRRDLVAEGSQP